MNTPAALTLEAPAEHPFAPFVRILGKGKRGARNLTREEAREAMGMLLEDKVEDTQLGAFLMLLRHKEESAEEMAGFTEAVRERLTAPAIRVDIDWPTYAGKKRHLPWYLLAAKCLAQNGVRIFMHGGGAHTAGRLYSEQLLDALAIPLCRNWQSVNEALDTGNLAFMPLQDWAPHLQRMIDLRNTLGLRSPIHSLARILNPLGARCGLQSIFHPGYQSVHREASSLLGDNSIVIKGDGGEVEINPDTLSHLYGTTAGVGWDEEWPALSAQRHVKPASLQPEHLLALWRGEVEDSYPQLALLSTMALALRGLGTPREQAFEQAQRFWDNRDTSI
ncbi:MULTISPECIES: glycosyl transferase family protein [Pseudomonas]|jgi:Anthranilate phosphoribosyltransferase|uniref:Glycosyl transferase family protein n=2 Tax=Pseudomonas TaxID=286 RepID=A0A9Q6YFI9_PSEFR|nr:glycosyl transferase family protein [Pseudomonas fragi]MDE4516698.1 glycosyl transferase family protein [Pseudomonas fragi]NNB07835.1 glycosyl transferase family protein [Pseudomonas fragi]QPC37436.1 glycosyl transferase family protein [Pseudomonas fragi]QPL33400.1 glycosyl transferase family protein [Pseudomonas fragi]SDU17973.1 Anthranilate phosphoribosyltransferase [Pseudomonas fragi]